MNVHQLKTLKKDRAQEQVVQYEQEYDHRVDAWSRYEVDVPAEYADFRNALLAAFQNASTVSGGKQDKYYVDLMVGLELYEQLLPENGFTNDKANNDGIWRYISVMVMPDITYMRYPKPENAVRDAGGLLNHKRFYAATRRIWLKSLWWYIHLSWQGSRDATYNILKDNGIDDINKLIETPGKGYRFELYRKLMYVYGTRVPKELKASKYDFFAKMTQLNNAKCVSIEPSFYSGGIDKYAVDLVEEILNSGDINHD